MSGDWEELGGAGRDWGEHKAIVGGSRGSTWLYWEGLGGGWAALGGVGGALGYTGGAQGCTGGVEWGCHWFILVCTGVNWEQLLFLLPGAAGGRFAANNGWGRPHRYGAGGAL